MHIGIEEDLQRENAQLRAELERLKGHNSVSEQVEALTAALDATKMECQELRRKNHLLSKQTNTSGITTVSNLEVQEVLKAKEAEAHYFTETFERMKKDHSDALSNERLKKEQAQKELDDLRTHLKEQEERTLQYSQAIDATSDKFYLEHRTLQQQHLEERAKLQADLFQLQSKLEQTIHAAEQFQAERDKKDKECQELQQRLVTLSRRASKDGGELLEEARKEIRLMEKTIADLTDEKARIHQAHKQELLKGGDDNGMVASLQRQLAQVEFEKAQIEKTLEKHQRTTATTNIDKKRVTFAKQSHKDDPERVQLAKNELKRLSPAFPALVQKLHTLLSAIPKSSTLIPDTINVEQIQRACEDLKVSFAGLEQVRLFAVKAAQDLARDDDLNFGTDTAHLDRTPTMNRRRIGIPTGIEPSKLF